MKYLFLVVASVVGITSASGAEKPPKPLVSGLTNPESAVIGGNGKLYVTTVGEFNKDGDGTVSEITDGKAIPFVKGLNDPKGIAAYQKFLFVTDKDRVLRIDASGKIREIATAKSFPTPPKFLNDIVVDPESGLMYVSDSGNLEGKEGAIYRVSQIGKAELVIDAQKFPGMKIPNGLVLDGQAHLLMGDFSTGELHRIKLADKSVEKVAEGFGGLDGIVWDQFGRLFITDHPAGKLYVIPRPGTKPILLAEGFQGAADICLDPKNKTIIVPDMKAGTVHAVPITVPGEEVDETPLEVQPTLAFPDIQWTGWKRETDSGRPFPFRPILLTHAGDGSNRVFVPTQQGVVHVFPNDQKVAKSEIFIDLTDRVQYNDQTNEEGFLGMAFHPKFKENGEFFVFYTPKKEKLTNIVSRFRLSKDNPKVGDPSSEEEIIRFKKPFWNHDGGTICFGPDGFLYVTHGDGGFANDPQENGQNLKSLLGKVLRIDIDHQQEGKKYAIPKDNPFVGEGDARPEIWAYGLRNLWRMAFDRKTGQLWAGEVGQNLYEEIIIVTKGGNYGWNRRESFHPFGVKGVGVNKEMIEPIWEYHHDVGKSITGGVVYRGSKSPELEGMYLYADYITNKLWALKYDESKGRVVANRPIKIPTIQIFSFGEDEKGEAYFLTETRNGKGIYWFGK